MRIHDESGFTLAEITIAAVILGIIVATLSASIIVGLKTTDDTQQRLAESHDAQMTSSFFGSDVQSAKTFSTTSTACAGVAPVIHLEWGDGVTKQAAYFIDSSVSGERQLVRKYCEGGTTSTVVIAHHLAATGPGVTCVPSPCTATPRKVTLTLDDIGGFQYTLSGTRRSA